MYRPLLTVARNLLRRDLRTASGPLFAEKFINRVQILGRVGCDPRVFHQDEQRQLVFFDVVTHQVFKKTQEDGSIDQSEKATFHSFVVKRPGLKDFIANYLVKGSRVLCNGSLETRNVVGEDGREYKSTSIVLHEIVIVDDRKRNNQVQDEYDLDY